MLLKVAYCVGEHFVDPQSIYKVNFDLRRIKGQTSLLRSTRKVMPRSHIHGSPRWFYYGLNLTDDPGNTNFVVRYGCTLFV